MVANPILPGFNPDPSIVRVGDAYYIATSTFEWYPGVQIHRSYDLQTWELVARPLNRASLLDMRGVPDSCGVWAPCLTHADGRFWLIYTVVRRFDGDFKDTPNFLTTCESIDGEWTDPVYLNSSGFDPSLFHDHDGRKYLANMVWDHRPDRSYFRGILLQEYDAGAAELTGPRKLIYTGSERGFTEGPHIYRRDERYYLMVAEGGTGYGHAVTLARSDSVWGPYETDPSGSFISSRDLPEASLQRCGHGSMVEAPDGRLFVAHLASRPLSPQQRFSPMGRETALQEVAFNSDGWLALVSPQTAFDAVEEIDSEDKQYRFDTSQLDPDFQWLRTPEPDAIFSLTERPGSLRLYGRESLGSNFVQTLVARRQTHFQYTAETELDFAPDDFQQMAGLVAYYNAHKHHYLFVSWDEEVGRHLSIQSCLGRLDLQGDYPIHATRIAIPNEGPIQLGVDIQRDQLQFRYALGDGVWMPVGPVLDASVLSDEAGKGEGANFTGSFVGMACQDLTGRGAPADFAWFRYSAPGRGVT